MIRRIIKIAVYVLVRLISRIIYFAGHKFAGREATNNKARILAYHRVCQLPREKWIEQNNVLPAAFEEQMRYLKEADYNVITLSDLVRLCNSEEHFTPRTVVLTFDDGYVNTYQVAYPIMKDYGFLPTVFIIADLLEIDGSLGWPRSNSGSQLVTKQNDLVREYLNIDELTSMSNQGVEIGSHSKTHQNLVSLDENDLEMEVLSSRQTLSKRLGTRVQHFCYPFGLITESKEKTSRIIEVIRRSGYASACCGRIGAVRKNSNVYLLKRIPVYEQDRLVDFKAKVNGAFDWVGYFQRLLALFLPTLLILMTYLNK